ncbi:MAG TPA: hypothetical protein VF039_00175 [Longimicrobiales bacterium]
MRSYLKGQLSVALVALAFAACSSAPEPTTTPAPQAPAARPAPTFDMPPAPTVSANDPRSNLRPGYQDAGVAAGNVRLVGHVGRPAGFESPEGDVGDLLYGNSDMAFRGNTLFIGNFHGFNVYDISGPVPQLRKSFVCPGGQGDLSIHGNLLFMSVEMPNGRIDCGTQGTRGAADPERFRGVRVFDVSDLNNPRQVAAVQTCRGSHTHTLVTDPDDDDNVYIYVQGAANVRPAEELAGCSGRPPSQDTSTAYFRIEVIQVPLAAPQNARIVNAPRIFADPQTGEIAGLSRGGQLIPGGQQTSGTNQCHDITAYPHFGIAGGACAGNGIILDISDAANPRRIEEVVDPNFAYWHSATFNNAATTVLFTDEWGGGSAPFCKATDNPRWGADAIFSIENGGRELDLQGYYKLPAAQSAIENCVAHNGNIIPVPGRDIMAQAWYQGGMSIVDFTDPEHPFEIAYFDRGPITSGELALSGYWSTYWYNGRIYGSEIGRGVDVFELEPSEHLSANEIAAAREVQRAFANPQHQDYIEWRATPAVARAYLDQLARSGVMPDHIATLRTEVEAALATTGAGRTNALAHAAGSAVGFAAHVDGVDRQRLEALSRVLGDIE